MTKQTHLLNSIDTQIMEIGAEKTPVIIIDNLLDDPDSLLALARQQHFQFDSNWAYPGLRCSLPDSYLVPALQELVPLIRQTYSVAADRSYETIHSVFSLLAQPPETLSLLQRIPHYDTTKAFYFASVHYLSPGEFGGTGFFRHRPTGFERITDERYPDFVAAAKRHMRAHGEPPRRYINASTDHFELIGEIEYRPNRIAIYPGNILHSGLVQPERDLSMDPVSGRLTANLFLDFDVDS